MKQQKIEQVRQLVSNPGDKFVRCLATGKYFRNDREITRAEWDAVRSKHITINLGEGEL